MSSVTMSATSGTPKWNTYQTLINTVIYFFIITNLIHKFLVHSHKLHKIKFLHMFRVQSAHHQEVNNANCTYAASGIVTLCKWPSCATTPSLAVAQDGHLQRVTIPEAAYLQSASLTSWWWADCVRNMWRNLILCNLCEWTMKFLYQDGNNKKVILWCTANQISRLSYTVSKPKSGAPISKFAYLPFCHYWM